MEAETLGDTLSDAQAVVDTLSDWVADMEAEMVREKLSDAQAMVDKLAAFRKYWSTRWLTRKQRYGQRS